MNRADHSARRRRSVRWALVLAPVILFIGMYMGWISNSGEENPWFAALEKPALYPPPIAFPIVWSILYLLMGIALALVITAPPLRWKRPAIIAFIVQLLLNFAWTPTFFGAHAISWALGLIVVLDVVLIATIVLFGRVDKRAAWLLAPYLAWSLFATGLNWQILQDNPAADGAPAPMAARLAV